MCMFFAFCRSSSPQNAGSCACYCQNSCWSRVGPVTPLNLCTEQQANRFQSAHGQFKRFQKHHSTTEFPACRAQWHNAPLLERPSTEKSKQFHGSTPQRGLRPLHPICHEHLPGSAAKSLLWPSGGRANKHQINITYPPTSYMFLGCLTGRQNKVVIRYAA